MYKHLTQFTGLDSPAARRSLTHAIIKAWSGQVWLLFYQCVLPARGLLGSRAHAHTHRCEGLGRLWFYYTSSSWSSFSCCLTIQGRPPTSHRLFLRAKIRQNDLNSNGKTVICPRFFGPLSDHCATAEMWSVNNSKLAACLFHLISEVTFNLFSFVVLWIKISEINQHN